jgi:hypothetical protein
MKRMVTNTIAMRRMATGRMTQQREGALKEVMDAGNIYVESFE